VSDPIKWFEEAVNSGKYQKEIIDEIKSCISKNSFNINQFMNWVLEQLEKDTDRD
jgi:hypothetical protein